MTNQLEPDSSRPTPGAGNQTYPQFVIDTKTGQIEVNLIDKASGRVVRHIPATELRQIVRRRGFWPQAKPGA